MNSFNFNPVEGLSNKEIFASRPESEEQARAQIQTPLNQLRDFINATIVDFFNNGGTVGGSITSNVDVTAVRNIIGKDAWIGAFLQNTNGYTKLTNGMIMQWGSSIVTINSGTNYSVKDIVLPITFSTSLVSVQSNVAWNNTDNGQIFHLPDTVSNIMPLTNSSVKVLLGKSNGVNVSSNVNLTVQWTAIGY